MIDDLDSADDGAGATTTAGLSAAFERLSAHSVDWSADRVMDEGLDLIRDSMWADSSALYLIDGDVAIETARRPVNVGIREREQVRVPLDWFPWGLAPVNPRRFLLVSDAGTLACDPFSRAVLADLGVSSCLHLPILERQRAIGALHLYWSEPRLGWDDDRGRLLRLLGRFLLGRRRGPTMDRPVLS